MKQIAFGVVITLAVLAGLKKFVPQVGQYL
jgi:hypothetical protein